MPSIVKSAHRTISVLELFDRTQRPLKLTEIAEDLAAPTSSTQDLLRSLVTLGYLYFDRRTHAYFPTLRVSVLGDWIEQAVFGEGHYRALMKYLRDETGETIGIGGESDLDVQFLQILTGTYPLTLNFKAGDRAPLCTTAMGRALLSKRPKPYVQKLLLRHNSIVESRADRVTEAELMDALDFFDQTGYAVSRENTLHGLSGIAMILPNAASQNPVVIGVSGPSDRINSHHEKIVEFMFDGLKKYF